ncbi:PREDICTED: gem-associated protein 5 [Nicrophorus vespilloides]|uniref:Gem-associated protein 5 n=1 Tax=Nicrophorus vespilloides TaxID=110193 RepID=A0ABM1MCA0_NICVS|nr:PREDICTED: gem-associated protein 5 [Nicrophorus vespilloides]
MNNLLIPPSPNWYEPNIMACTKDNTVCYASMDNLIIIKNKQNINEPAKIKIISHAHIERIFAVTANPNWADPDKLILSSGSDKLVKLWDGDTYKRVAKLNTHTTTDAKLVGATFAGKDKVVSVSEDGFITIWRFRSNEKNVLKNMFGSKVHVTAISSCPHAPWLAAFGFKSGMIVIADMRKEGTVKYKLRGHDRAILSLSWCPAPLNFFPKTKPRSIKVAADKVEEKVDNVKVDKDPVAEPKPCTSTDDLKSAEKTERTFYKPKKNNPWVNLKHADDDEIEPEEVPEVTKESGDFLADCLALQQKIISTKDTEIEESEEAEEEKKETNKERKIIKAKKTLPQKEFDNDIKTDEDKLQKRENFKSDDQKLKDKHIETDEDKLSHMIENVDINEEYTKEFLLASSARGGPIFIWRAGTDGRMQLKLATNAKKQQNYRRYSNQNDKNFVTLNWIAPKILLSSGITGELYKWDLMGDGLPKVVHNNHPQQLFCIAAPVQIYNEVETTNELGAWTTGIDRMLFYTNINHKQDTIKCYPTLGNSVLAMSLSPLDPNRLALTLADGTIRIWDLSKPHIQYIDMIQIKFKNNVKIMSLAWHPTQDSILAFGTEEGRVAFINTINLTKPPTLLPRYFRQPIQCLEFGPHNGDMGLYVCSEGKVGIYETEKPLNDPNLLEFTSIANAYVTQFAWKPDYSLLAIGLKSGVIMIYTAELKFIRSIYYHQKAIETFAWHPQATMEDEETSPNATWLASTTTTDTNVVIYKLDDVTKDDFDVSKSIVAELSGHLKFVRKIFWSPHENGRLCTVSDDGTARIWNANSPNSTSVFMNVNAESINAGVWSPLDKKYIISSGKESSIIIWNIDEHGPKSIEEIHIQRNKRKILIQNIVNQTRNANPKSKEIVCIDDKKKVTRDVAISLVSKSQRDIDDILKDCRNLIAHRENPDSNEKSSVLKLFGTPENLSELLHEQMNENLAKHKYTGFVNVALYNGNIGDAIKEAMQKDQLNPWLISLAPMVSPKLWQDACLAYAQKLSDSAKADPLEAASYFLACHEIEKAIDVMCVGGFYREALVLAKSRMPTNTKLADDIMGKWSTFCLYNGRFDVAAQIFVAMDKYEEAAKMLYKRSDVQSLEFAAELAEKSENNDLLASITFRLNSFKDHAHKELIEKTEALAVDDENKENIANSDIQSNESTVTNDEEN